jgi:2-polyprenyl-3-methyl-5-hydroxy-6-metoxy-1,4-benzoquinol methylase
LECDLVFRHLQDSYDRILATYRYDYFSKYSIDQTEGGRDSLFQHILGLIEKRAEIGRVLDVGSGYGFFLLAAQKRGWKAKGIEPSLRSVQVSQNQLGLDVFPGSLQDFRNNGTFDVITFINVLDHSAMPWLEIDRAYRLLRPGGLIYLRFPNGSLHNNLYRIMYRLRIHMRASKYLVFHQYSFTSRYIKRLLRDYGFSRCITYNSPPTQGDPHVLFPKPKFAECIKLLVHEIAEITQKFSRTPLFIGTSLEVTAIKASS